MGLFKKRPEEQPQVGRRRPLDTDTGLRRSQAFSYYASRPQTSDNSGRTPGAGVERSERQNTAGPRSQGWLAWIILPAAVAGVMYMLYASGDPVIIKDARGSSAYFLQDVSAYEQTVRRTLGGSLLNKNKLTLDEYRVRADLLENYPEIAQVSVEKPLLGHAVTVRVRPHTPSFILTTADSKAFLLDSNGRALVSASQISDSGELSVPTLHDTSTLDIKLGSQALPRSIIDFTQAVTTSLEQKGIGISSLTLPRTASQLDVHIAGAPYYVKFNLQDDARQQIGSFLAAKARLEKDRTIPVSHIDVRVPGRVYFQ